MNYFALEQMGSGIYAQREQESDQAYMERILRAACAEGAPEQKCINDLLNPTFYECDADNLSLTLSFVVQEWMLNPQGMMHGGIIATVMDMTMGLLVRYCRRSTSAVTVQMSINFMRGISWETEIRVRAEAEKIGRKLAFMGCKLYDASAGNVGASASATFM